MKSLVVPVNFSDCAACAARYAADLAMAINAEVHLINVVSTSYSSTEMVMTESQYETMIDSANAFMKGMQADLQRRTNGKVPIYTQALVGTVSGQVDEFCSNLQPYAIVLGASGPTFEKFLAGSPLNALLGLPYPVLVVPEKTTFHAFERIVLACDVEDLKSGLPHSLTLIKELRQRFHAQVDVITVENWKTVTGEEYYLQEDARQIHLKELEPQMHFVHKDKVKEGLMEFIGDYPADLVIVFPKKHNILEFHASQSKAFAKHGAIPVLSLHE